MSKKYDVVPSKGFLRDLVEGSSGFFNLLCRDHFVEAYRNNSFGAWCRYDPITEEEFEAEVWNERGTVEEVNGCDWVGCGEGALFEVYDSSDSEGEGWERPAECSGCGGYLVIEGAWLVCGVGCGYREEL